MNSNSSQLESLPNEILVEILEHLNARELFRAFYNVNSRFNELLTSISNLCFILSTRDRDEETDDENFLQYIHTLIIKNKTNVMLNRFTNIRRLILIGLPNTRPYKLENVFLPRLEHLVIISMSSMSNFSMDRVQEPIFSNNFPCLQFCSLPKTLTLQKTARWTKLLSLKVLKLGHIGLFTYMSILAACPNLTTLTFIEERILQTSTVLPKYVNHANLKRLIITDKYIGPTSRVDILNEYLSCVPNLKNLHIYVKLSHKKNLRYLFEFDWFFSIISVHLPVFCKFNAYLSIFSTNRNSVLFDECLCSELEKRFSLIYENRFQARLFINKTKHQRLHYYESTDSSESSDSDGSSDQS